MSADPFVDAPVSEWSPAVVPLCGAFPPPDPCDCGFAGEWEHRWVYGWHEKPGYRRTDQAIRYDMKQGRPARPKDEGWWVIVGYDERCPGCGDIERFDLDGKRVALAREQGVVVPFRPPLAAALEGSQ